MGINIAVCETEAERAPCRIPKQTLVKIRVKENEFTGLQEYNEVVSMENAKKAFPDFEAFMKRNRFSDKTTSVFMENVKNDSDAEALKPYIEKIPTGWIDLRKLDDAARAEVLEKGTKVDTINGWNEITLEETNRICSECPLSWDKGRGCIGGFGPENSLLPSIAEKYGCTIVASVPAAALEMKKFTAQDAEELLRETGILKEKLPEEGKMAVHRYSGPVERMEAVAKACISEKCGFYFF